MREYLECYKYAFEWVSCKHSGYNLCWSIRWISLFNPDWYWPTVIRWRPWSSAKFHKRVIQERTLQLK